MKGVREIGKIENTAVLVRTSLNVPIDAGKVINDYRLRRALPTIRFLSERGARVILISHIGEAGTETLAPVAEALGKLISPVTFCPASIGPVAREAIRALSPGQILMLENLRRNRGEVMNDPSFSAQVAELGDVFVQDSFDTCHRSHASIVGVPKLLPSYAGLQLEEEVRELSAALTPKEPSLAIIGGAKFSTKEAVLTTLLSRYTNVFVGGALANDFLQAAGHQVGKSLVGGDDGGAIRALINNPKLVLPVDSRVVPASAVGTPNVLAQARVAGADQVKEDEVILDHGPGTELLLSHLVQKSKTVLWNGPLGKYEDGFVGSTDVIAQAVADSGVHSVLGGGDTVAAIEVLGLLPKFSFVSTGGGAMLDFLAEGTLPGITALG
jgi:phosphoglycerate kinase